MKKRLQWFYTVVRHAGGFRAAVRRVKSYIALVTLPTEMYHKWCTNSAERAFNNWTTLSPEEKREFREMVLALERSFRNAQWEEGQL